MRRWINLFEGRSLVELAHDLIAINDDILPDHVLEDFDESEAECLRIIEMSMHSGSCDDFATVCQDLTGDQPYAIRDGNSHHTVLSTSDENGELYDVTGFVTFEEVCKRYRFSKRAQIYETGGWHGDEWEKELILDVIRYLKSIGRAPFTSFPV